MKPQMSANASLVSVRHRSRCVQALDPMMMKIKRDVCRPPATNLHPEVGHGVMLLTQTRILALLKITRPSD